MKIIQKQIKNLKKGDWLLEPNHIYNGRSDGWLLQRITSIRKKTTYTIIKWKCLVHYLPLPEDESTDYVKTERGKMKIINCDCNLKKKVKVLDNKMR